MVLDAVALQHYMKDLMQGLFGDMLVWEIFQRDLRSQLEPAPAPAPPAQAQLQRPAVKGGRRALPSFNPRVPRG